MIRWVTAGSRLKIGLVGFFVVAWIGPTVPSLAQKKTTEKTSPATVPPSQGGKLPRPKSKNPVTGPTGSSDKKPRYNCFQELLLPPGGNGTYSPDNKFLYLLVSQKFAAVPGSSRARYSFYQIDLDKRLAVPTLALNQLSGAALVTYVYPLQGVSAVVFNDSFPGCYSGRASIVSVSFQKQGSKAVKASGEYSLVEGPAGLQLFDQAKQAIVEVDYVTFQTRVARSVPKGQLPLYYDSGTRELFTLDSKERRLHYYKVGSQEPDRIMSLRKNERVSQRGRSFGVVAFKKKKNRLFLKEIPFWSGESIKEAKVYAVRLPKKFAVQDAAVEFHVGTKVAVIHGLTPEIQDRWRRSYIIQYNTGKLVKSVLTPAGQRVGFARISPNGKNTVVQVINSTTFEQKSLTIVDNKKGKSRSVEMLDTKKQGS